MLSKEDFSRGLQQIPPLPVVIIEILHLLEQEGIDYDVLSNKISADASLASRMLTVANSPFFGLSGEIGSMREAIMVLGLHTIRRIVIAAGFIEKFPPGGGNHLNLIDIWVHSIGVAVSARVLAGFCHLDREEAFTAGLLHDIGKMILDVHFAEHYESVVRYRDEQGCLLRDAEQHILRLDHTAVGGIMAQRWNLPPSLQQAIALHHQPPSDPPDSYVDLVHIADVVTRGLEIGDGGDTRIPQLEAVVLQRLGLNSIMLQKSFAEIERLSRLSLVILG